MKKRMTLYIVLVCLVGFVAAVSDAYAWQRSSGGADTTKATSAGRTGTKSYAAKTFDNKTRADIAPKMFGRMYANAANQQCAYISNKGLQCKRKSEEYSRFCRQHKDEAMKR